MEIQQFGHIVSKELWDEMQAQPKLTATGNFYIQIFCDLNNERHHGMGLMAIPYTRILQYCQFHRLSRDQTQEVCYVITMIDMIYLSKLQKEQEAEAKKRKSLTSRSE